MKMNKYWANYWKRQAKPEKCIVCHDAGIISAATSNSDGSMKVKPCPCCKKVK